MENIKSEQLLEWKGETWVVEERPINGIFTNSSGEMISENTIKISIYSIMDAEDPTFQIYLRASSYEDPLYAQAKHRFLLETIEDIKRMF